MFAKLLLEMHCQRHVVSIPITPQKNCLAGVIQLASFAKNLDPDFSNKGSTEPARISQAHVALKGDRSFYFAPVKRSLLQRSGLASHWSATHDGYWSAVSYGCCASTKKPAETLDPSPLLWAASGEPGCPAERHVRSPLGSMFAARILQ